LFKQKVAKTFRWWVDVDETYVGGQDDQAIGRMRVKGDYGCRCRVEGKGASRMYGLLIETVSKKDLKKFIEEHTNRDAHVRTDGWTDVLGQ
jgi:hypothetical protein